MCTTVFYQADMDLTPVVPGRPAIHIRGGPKPIIDTAEISYLGSLRFGLFGSRAYLDQLGLPAGLEDLGRYGFIAHDQQRNRAPWEKWLSQTLPDAYYYLRTDCEIAHRVAVSTGLCLGFLPASALLYYPNLIEIPTPTGGWEAPMWLVVDHEALKIPCLASAAEKIAERLNRVWG